MITKKTTHVREAIGKLLEEFKGQPKIEGLLQSYIEPIQSLENVLDGLRASMDLATAATAALDRLGRIVGVQRDGATDAQYRIAIRAGILANKSRGTVGDIIELVDFLLGFTDGVTMTRGATGDLEYTLELDLDLPDNVSWNLLIYYICRMSQAGGTGFIEFPYDTTTGFYWDTTSWDDGKVWGSAASTRVCLTEYEADQLGYFQSFTDEVAPTVTITPAAAPVELGAAAIWTVTFADETELEASPSLLVGDLSLGGTDAAIGIASVTGSNPFTVTTNATSQVSSDLTLTVAAGVVQDTAGNANVETTSAALPVTDTVAPTVTIVHDAGDSQLAVDVASPRCAWTVTFSDLGGLESPLPTLNSSHFTVTAGETWQLGSYTWDIVNNGGGEYQVAIEGMQYVGEATLVVAAGAIEDASGNGNALTAAPSAVTLTATPFTVTATYNAGSSDTDGSGDGAVSLVYNMSFSDSTSDFDIVNASSVYTPTGTATFTAGPTFTGLPTPFNLLAIDATVDTAGTLGATVTYDPVASGYGAGSTPPGDYRQGFATYTAAEQTLTSTLTDFEVFTSTPLTIAGTGYSPVYAWAGNDATSSSWPLHSSSTGSGISLVQSNGGSATTGVSTPIDGLTGVTNGSTLDCWVDTAVSALDLGIGEDLIVEVIYQHEDSQRLVGSVTSTANEGVVIRTTGRMVLNVKDNDGDTVQRINNVNPVDNDWYYGAFVFTRATSTNQSYVYDNVSGISPSTAATLIATITSVDGQTYIAGIPGAALNNAIAYVGIYKASDFNTHSSGDLDAAFDARVTLLGGTPGASF